MCEVRRQRRYFATRHGWQRYETFVLTPHGEWMAAMRRNTAPLVRNHD